MDKKTMGTFLAALRKAKGMTQQDVADILNVSNKTISKWERDDGCPEIMMLPAIAELFEVTVDELLRGERIISCENTDTFKDIKTEKRVKYIFDKAVTKYINLSIISVALGIVATVMACLMGQFSYDQGSIVCIVAIVLSAASIIIESVALNTFFSSIKSDILEIDAKALDMAKKKAALFLSLTIALAIAVILCTIAVFVLNAFFFVLIALILGVLAFAVTYPAICKKLGVISLEFSAEFKKYRKKHIKITAVITSLTVAAALILNFSVAAANYNAVYSFCFIDAVGYQYATEEEAISDYFKMKDFFENKKEIYSLIDEHPTENGYRIYVDEINLVFTEDENGYQVTEEYNIDWSDEQEINFDSYEQAEEFMRKNVIKDSSAFASAKKGIRFDDNTHTVYHKPNLSYWHYALDKLPIFILAGAAIAAAEAVVSLIIYFSKKKKEIQTN